MHNRHSQAFLRALPVKNRTVPEAWRICSIVALKSSTFGLMKTLVALTDGEYFSRLILRSPPVQPGYNVGAFKQKPVRNSYSSTCNLHNHSL